MTDVVSDGVARAHQTLEVGNCCCTGGKRQSREDGAEGSVNLVGEGRG